MAHAIRVCSIGRYKHGAVANFLYRGHFVACIKKPIKKQKHFFKKIFFYIFKINVNNLFIFEKIFMQF